MSSTTSTAFATTVVGSMPKRAWLFAETRAIDGHVERFANTGKWSLSGEALKLAQEDAIRAVVLEQEHAGVEIISDGEQRRGNYVTHVTSKMEGFDYRTLAEHTMRAGRRTVQVGRCVGPIRHKGPIIVDDLKFLKAHTERPVKVTLPGPMTVWDSTADVHYNDAEAMAFAWAEAINVEARLLDALNPAVIQFDEPCFSRYPKETEAWGIAALDRCLEGLKAKTAVHICYGYPQPGLGRPVVDTYPQIIGLLENSAVQQLALEFEGSKLDPKALKACPSKTVLFGCVFNSDDAVETPRQVADRLLAAAEVLSPQQIQAAPDCGLVTMSQPRAVEKLRIMVEGAQIAREKAGF